MMYQLHFSRAVQYQIESVSSGAIMAGINVSKLKNIIVHVPPIQIQEQFTTFAEQIDKSKSCRSNKWYYEWRVSSDSRPDGIRNLPKRKMHKIVRTVRYCAVCFLKMQLVSFMRRQVLNFRRRLRYWS